MNNNKEKDYYKKKKSGKEYANNVTKDVIYNKLCMAKTSNQEHYSKKFIADFCATPHRVKLEENMIFLKVTETKVTIGDSRTLTGTKCADWNGHQRCDGILYCVTLSIRT